MGNGSYRGVETKGLGVGLSGAHRTGKTTLAKKFAELNGFKFIGSPASIIANVMKLDLNNMTFEERLRFQWAVLRQMENLYAKQTSFFVTDRTPIDFAAYLLADVPHDLEDRAVMEEIERYVAECYRILNERFVVLGVLPPAVKYVEEPGKPRFNSAFTTKLHHLITGLAVDDRREPHMIRYLPGAITLERRNEVLAEEVAKVWKQIELEWGHNPS